VALRAQTGLNAEIGCGDATLHHRGRHIRVVALVVIIGWASPPLSHSAFQLMILQRRLARLPLPDGGDAEAGRFANAVLVAMFA